MCLSPCRLSTRRAVAVLALLVVAVAPVREAKAQWAVIDPAHIVKSVANGRQLVDQLRAQRDQLVAFRQQVQGLTSFEFRDLGSFMSQVDRAIDSGRALSYVTRDLDRAFADAYVDSRSAGSNAAADAYVQRRLDGALGTLRSLREHAAQLGGSRLDVQRLQAQIRGADTAQQIAEVQGSVQAYQAQEAQMIRQMLMLQAGQTANDQAEEAARFQYAREYARTLSERNRRDIGRMGGRSYTGSVFSP